MLLGKLRHEQRDIEDEVYTQIPETFDKCLHQIPKCYRDSCNY